MKRQPEREGGLPSVRELALFRPDRLTFSNFPAAVDAFESTVYHRSKAGAVLATLLERPLVLEVALSAVSVDTFALYRRHLLETFPKHASALPPSLAAALLERLGKSLFFLPCGSRDPEILRHRQAADSALPVLAALARGGFSGGAGGAEPESPTSPMSPEVPDVFTVKRKQGSQKQAKRARRAPPPIDAAPFARARVPVPESEEEAAALEARLLLELKETLQAGARYYLKALRQDDFADALRELYIGSAQPLADTPVAANVDIGDAAPAEAAPADAPVAYPMVQPMRAALYFDSADGFGEWRVLIAQNADRDLREARNKAPGLFKIYLKKIKELSCGMFSADNQKRLTGPGTEVPIFEAKMTGDSRLVYQIDCIPEFDSGDVEKQVVKIFGIYTHAQLDSRFWDSMSHQLGNKGREYRRRCVFRNQPLHKGDYVVSPASFPEPRPEERPDPAETALQLRAEDLDGLHSLLVLEKFVVLSQALLNSIIANQEIAHVFAVSPHEKKIIEHTSSCYVLGRSGTGKTTTMLFKILGIERIWSNDPEAMPKPRQVFVTQSRMLASKVEEYFSKLLDSLATAHHTPKELTRIAKTAKESRLVDEDDEENWRGDLPTKFSQLQDEHFPLFVTYDRLCRMLEADIDMEVDTSDHRRAQSDGSLLSPVVRRREADTFIAYYDFLAHYWGHFAQSLTKNLDPALVWSEILGVLKGSEKTLEHLEGHLDQNSYLGLSSRTNSTFASQRTVVWQLFMAYMKHKRVLGHVDSADRTRRLLNHWRDNKVAGQKIDFLYVDEAQDNLLIDALLLRHLCRNPDGLFWAGDTAQTIANGGSAFRFDDLKAFLYRVEAQIKTQKDYPPKKSIDPKTFQLAVNYRSHGGIVSCASSVVRVITEFWPYSIDAMEEETGIVDGLKPVVFSGWDEDSLRYEQFLFGGSAGDHMEFGAEQCILVRDDAARDKLRSEVGDIGLIMTLYESKGLEFNDVLLFNFFKDSTVDLAQWRVVLNMLPKEGRNASAPAPRFDEMKHAGVCAELKFLYVAITRARKNLWVIDCSPKSEPLKTLWSSQDLIRICTPGMEVPRLAVSSTAEEWEKSGRTLFRSKRYLQAMHCFDRAGLRRETAVAQAYLHREHARNLSGGTKQLDIERARAFIVAADAFSHCADEAVTEKKAYYRAAGECYAQASQHKSAGKAFLEAAEYTLSARQYRKGSYFDEAVGVVQTYEVDPQFADTLLDVAKIYYITSGAPEKATPLFDTIDEQLEYMEDADLDVERATLLESLGRFSEAADVHFSEGRPLQALDLLLQKPGDPLSLQRGTQHLLEQLWRCLSFGVHFAANEKDPATQQLLETSRQLLALTERLDPADLGEREANEIAMFKAIRNKDYSNLLSLGYRLGIAGAKAASLLCLDHAFRTGRKLATASEAEVSLYLRQFYTYLHLLRDITTEHSVQHPGVRRLFGLSFSDSDGTYLVLSGTYLHKFIVKASWPALRSGDEGLYLSSSQASGYLRFSILEHLRIRVDHHGLACGDVKAFEPCCISYTVFGQCNSSECRRQHINVRKATKDWFSLRVGIHLQQIMILQTAHSLLPGPARINQRRFWLSKLYDSLFPPHYSLGSPSCWDRNLLPETQRAVEIVKDWLKELIFSIDPLSLQPRARFLPYFIQAGALAKLFDEQSSHDYMYRARCMVIRYREFMRPPDGDYVLHDAVAPLIGQSNLSLARGMLFANHVLQHHLAIDISVFCDYLERLCSFISMQSRSTLGVPHNVMLPRSWLLSSLHRQVESLPQLHYYSLLLPLVRNIGKLLEAVQLPDTYRDWLSYAGRPLDNTRGFLIRQMFIARICKVLVLMRHNTSVGIQNDVFVCLRSLRRLGSSSFHPSCAAYVEASSPAHLTALARQSASNVSLDEMIMLQKRSLVDQPREVPGVRLVVYSNAEDIIPLIAGHSLLRAEAPVFKPKDAPIPEVSEIAESEGQDAQDVPGIAFEGTQEGLVNVTQVQTFSQEEERAARAIQVQYRRYLQAKQFSGTSRDAARKVYFEQCAERARTMHFQHLSYRLLFLGPLAHALLCVDRVHQAIFAAKKKAKGQLLDMKHEDLEDIRARQTKTNVLFRRACNLQAQIDPKSQMHERGSVQALRSRIIDLQNLLDELPSGMRLGIDVQDDFDMMIKAIVRERRSPEVAAKPKPSLVIDDDMDYEY